MFRKLADPAECRPRTAAEWQPSLTICHGAAAILWARQHARLRAYLGAERRLMGAEPVEVDGFLDEAQQDDCDAAEVQCKSQLH